MPQRSRNNLPLSPESNASESICKICSANIRTTISNRMMRRKMLERFREFGIINGTNGSGLDFVEKTESGFWSNSPDVAAVL